MRNFLPHVHGLRTVAILAVLFYHIDGSVLPGGYIGVDVFFVISGYLITDHIARSQRDGSFSAWDFYLRRIRRIIPNQLLIIFLTLVIAYYVFGRTEFALICSSAIYSVMLSANFFFLEHSGYFAPDAASMPLLHMWSLAVEEQFYLVWPMAVGALWVASAKLRTWIILGTFLLFFVLTEYAVANHPIAAFYMMPFRIIEFLCGGWLALLSARPTLLPIARNIACIVSVSVIAIAAVSFNESTPFPGLMALFPCIATSTLIAFAEGTTVGSVLGSRLAVAIGERSYALYLVHWPTIVFLDRLYPLGGAVRCILILTITFTVAEAIYRWWEKPWRYGIIKTHVRESYYVSSVALLALALIVLSANGWVRYSSAASDPTGEFGPSIAGCRNTNANTIADCESDVLVLGDSHTGHYTSALSEALENDDVRVARWTFLGCPPIFGAYKIYNSRDFSSSIPICRDLVQQWERDMALAPAPVVALAARWAWLSESPQYGRYTLRQDAMVRSPNDPHTMEHSRKVIREQLAYTVNTLLRAGKKVVLLGQVPLQRTKIEACVDKNRSDPNIEKRCELIPAEIVADRLRFMNETITAEAAKHPESVAAYLPFADFCGKHCRLTYQGHFIYSDDNHLNSHGQTFLASKFTRLRQRILMWLSDRILAY